MYEGLTKSYTCRNRSIIVLIYTACTFPVFNLEKVFNDYWNFPLHVDIQAESYLGGETLLLGHEETQGLNSTLYPRGERGSLGQRARCVAKHRLMLRGKFQHCQRHMPL